LLAVTRTAVVARVALAASATGLARLLSLLGARGGLHDLPLGDLLGLHVLVLLVLGARGRSGGVAHSSSPPSRAPSAIAATRPAYLLPPRSKTTASMPAFLARSATSSPTFFALAVLSPSKDRKSTRLNSSHVKISYAVFCLKKKKR